MRSAFIYSIGLMAMMSASGANEGSAPFYRTGAFSARASQEAFQPDGITQKISRASDGFFYVDAGVRGGTVRFLVDTGASHIIMSHADAKAAGGNVLRSKSSSIQTAGGKVKVDWIVIDRLQIAGQVLRDVEAAVPENDVELSLLGQNALAQFSRLEIVGDRLLLVP